MQVLSPLTHRLFKPFRVPEGKHLSPAKAWLIETYSNAVFHQPKLRHHDQLPTAWPKGTYSFRGRPLYEWVYAPPEGQRQTWKMPLLFVTGCRSRPAYFERMLRAISANGRPVICLGQHIPERQCGFMEPNRDMLISFMTDPDSPYRRIFKDRPCHLAGHSLGGYRILELRARFPKVLEAVHRGGLLLMNPYIRPPSLREETPWGGWRLKKFEARIRKIPHLLYGETIADLVFATYQQFIKGDKGYWSADGPPSNAQIGEMLWTTTRLFKAAVAKGFPGMIEAPDTIFFLGERDFMSDPETNRTLAGLMGAKVVSCNAGHTPIQESPAHMTTLLDCLDELDEAVKLKPQRPSFQSRPAIARMPSESAGTPLPKVA